MSEDSNSAVPTKTTIASLQQSFPELQLMIRDLSRLRFCDITSLNSVNVADHPVPDDFVYGAHLTAIQIASKDLRITFKSHFNHSQVADFIPRRTKSQTAKLRKLDSSTDLFKEYNNLVAGGITQQLNRFGIVAGISLPIASCSFDELIASDQIRPERLYDFWKVMGPNFEFTCTVCAEIFEVEILKNYVYSASDKGAGEIEML